MATLYDNYPDGVSGSHPYFDQPTTAPECMNVKCCGSLESEDWKFCPYCGERIDWDEVWEAWR